MKTRVVEVPVCDRCSRDGELLMVRPMNDGLEPFVISRCPSHLERLRDEASVEETLETQPNGSARRGGLPARTEPGGNGQVGHETERRREQVLELVKAQPGLTPREVAERLGTDRARVSTAASDAVHEGLIVVTGATMSARYWPKGYKIPAEFRAQPSRRKVRHAKPRARNRKKVKAGR